MLIPVVVNPNGADIKSPRPIASNSSLAEERATALQRKERDSSISLQRCRPAAFTEGDMCPFHATDVSDATENFVDAKLLALLP